MKRTTHLASGFVLLLMLNTVVGDEIDSTVVEFPSNVSVGKYALVDKAKSWQQLYSVGKWTESLKAAQGQVSIGADQGLILVLMGQRSNEKKPLLDPLTQLNESQLLSVSFVFSNLVSEEMERLERHQQLRVFATTLSKLNDDGLAAVCKSAKQLENLVVPETQVTNAGLASISRLANLQRLNVYGTRINEAGLIHLKKLLQLRELNIGLTRVNGSGLEHLSALTHLRKIVLWKTNIQDEDLVHLKPLQNLEYLDLKETNVTNTGLVNLTSLRKLKGLDLSSNRITDEGLQHLVHLKQLESLSLHGTGVSEQAAKQLELAIPKLKVAVVDAQNLKAIGAEAMRSNAIENRKDLDKYFESWKQ